MANSLSQARHHLAKLKLAMEDIRYEVPWALPGYGPTAADNCAVILGLMDFEIQQLERYLGPGKLVADDTCDCHEVQCAYCDMSPTHPHARAHRD
jgi:hypothetical protein